MKVKTGLLCLLSVVICGCAIWTPIKMENRRWQSGDFSAELPTGWNRSQTPDYFLYMTRDGVGLQNIGISKEKTGKELPNTKKKISEGMLLEDVADITLEELKLNKFYNNFELLENKPVELSTLPAFRLAYTYTNAEFVKFKVIQYGFIHKKKYYEIHYQATVQRNFDKYKADFENFLSSFRIKD